jgi:hypothetical protein
MHGREVEAMELLGQGDGGALVPAEHREAAIEVVIRDMAHCVSELAGASAAAMVIVFVFGRFRRRRRGFRQ